MDINVNYMTDSRGRRRSVVLSLADWKKVQHELTRMRLKEDLREAFREIDDIKAGRQEPVYLEDFLAEWDKEQPQAQAHAQNGQGQS